MKSASLRLLFLCLCPIAAWAADPAPLPAVAPAVTSSAAPVPTPAAAPAPAASGTTPAAPLVPGTDVSGREPIEPNVQHIVTEGESTRVEELRVRGQTQSITVKNKDAPAYEIVIGDGSRDMSSSGGAQKGAAGQRVWRLLSF